VGEGGGVGVTMEALAREGAGGGIVGVGFARPSQADSSRRAS